MALGYRVILMQHHAGSIGTSGRGNCPWAWQRGFDRVPLLYGSMAGAHAGLFWID